FFFSSRRRHTRFDCDWSSDVCSSDLSDLRSAEEALDRADAHLERSGGEAYTEAEILSFRASLRSTQGRFREAVKLLDRALAVREIGRASCRERGEIPGGDGVLEEEHK